MKKIFLRTLAVMMMLVISVMITPLSGFASRSKNDLEEFETATFEDILFGRCDGETVIVIAKAVEVEEQRYRNKGMVYRWYIQSEFGSYQGDFDDGWYISRETYRNAPADRREAIENGDLMRLKVNISKKGDVKVEAFITMEEESFDSTNFSEIITVIVAVIVIVILFVVGFAILFAVEKHKKAAYAALSASVVKTKFIDSSHTATSTSRTSTSSAIGRAAVGSMIAGPVGAVVGASTAKQRHTVNEHHTTTFMVYYSDGTHRHETVENNSSKYNLYMSKLEL